MSELKTALKAPKRCKWYRSESYNRSSTHIFFTFLITLTLIAVQSLLLLKIQTVLITHCSSLCRFFLFLTTAWGFSSSKLCLEETVNSDQLLKALALFCSVKKLEYIQKRAGKDEKEQNQKTKYRSKTLQKVKYSEAKCNQKKVTWRCLYCQL